MSKPGHHAFRLKMAKQKAEALLREERITTLPVMPIEIAARRDIEVKPMPNSGGGVSGMLLRHGDAFGILYATHVASEGFQNFSVAHELGHYFLDGHIDHILPANGTHTSHAGFVSAEPYELEADQFAAGLLMPAGPVKRALGQHDAGLEAVESLARLCHTSLTATAIRYTELTTDAVAIVISTGSVVDFCFFSDAIKSLPQLTWMRRGTPLPRATETAQLGAAAARVAAADRVSTEIDIMDWLGGTRSVAGTEESVGLGQYGKVLTVLTCPSVEDETYSDDDGDSDEDLKERWTPRFHR